MAKEFPDFDSLAHQLRSAETDIESALSEMSDVADELDGLAELVDERQELKDQIKELEERLREQEAIWLAPVDLLFCKPCDRFYMAGPDHGSLPCPKCANPYPVKPRKLVDVWALVTGLVTELTR